MLRRVKGMSWYEDSGRDEVEEKLAKARTSAQKHPSLRDIYERDAALLEERLGRWAPGESSWWILADKTPLYWHEVSQSEYDRICREADDVPFDLGGGEDRFWFFKGAFYKADGDLSADDVRALALEAANRKRLKLEKAHALQAMTETLDAKARRQPISQAVKVLVWQRDQGRCAECGSQENLEYDHVIPLALGGSNTDRNLQLLCETCNRRKGATLG